MDSDDSNSDDGGGESLARILQHHQQVVYNENQRGRSTTGQGSSQRSGSGAGYGSVGRSQLSNSLVPRSGRSGHSPWSNQIYVSFRGLWPSRHLTRLRASHRSRMPSTSSLRSGGGRGRGRGGRRRRGHGDNRGHRNTNRNRTIRGNRRGHHHRHRQGRGHGDSGRGWGRGPGRGRGSGRVRTRTSTRGRCRTIAQPPVHDHQGDSDDNRRMERAEYLEHARRRIEEFFEENEIYGPPYEHEQFFGERLYGRPVHGFNGIRSQWFPRVDIEVVVPPHPPSPSPYDEFLGID